MTTILKLSLVFACALALKFTVPLANAQKADENIFHPLFLFDRNFAEDASAKADCSIAMALNIWRTHTDPRVGDFQWPSDKDEFVRSFDGVRQVNGVSCPWRVKNDAAGAVYKKLQPLGKLGHLKKIEIEDKVLKQLNLDAIRTPDRSSIEYYAIPNALLFEKVYGRHAIVPKGKDLDTTLREFVLGKICDVDAVKTETKTANTDEASSTSTPSSSTSVPTAKESTSYKCKPTEGTAASFRRSLERLYFEQEFNRKNPTKPLERIRIFDLFVENVRPEKTRNSRRTEQVPSKFFYNALKSCPADKPNNPFVRMVLNCQATDQSTPDYRVLIAYKPKESNTNSSKKRELVAGVPNEPLIVTLRDKSQAILEDTFTVTETRFPGTGSVRLAKNPSQFLKAKTEEGASLKIPLDRDKKQETFEIDAALGYRVSNKIKPTSDCTHDSSVLCRLRLQVSATPFVAWQREQTENFKEDPSTVARKRDTLFAGVQVGLERITKVRKEELDADTWVRPNWRSALAFEAITDGEFEAEVYRFEGLVSPPWPDQIPNLGYRQRARIGDIWVSHNKHRQDVVRGASEISRCRNRFACSVWFEWDASLALEEIRVVSEPSAFDEEDPDKTLELFEGTRFGYDISAALSARSPFAFRKDKPWMELKTGYQNRQSEREGDGQAELFSAAFKLKDTQEGLFSYGIEYERGEDLRLGDEIESVTFQFDVKR